MKKMTDKLKKVLLISNGVIGINVIVAILFAICKSSISNIIATKIFYIVYYMYTNLIGLFQIVAITSAVAAYICIDEEKYNRISICFIIANIVLAVLAAIYKVYLV